MSTRPCPICSQPISKSKLLCLKDWRRVPSELQVRVNQAWRCVSQAKNPAVQLTWLRRHREASGAAIAAAAAAAAAGKEVVS